MLFVAYVLFWTGVKADSVMHDQIDQLQRQWSAKATVHPTAKATGAAVKPAAYHYGKPFAIMYIPKLDVKAPIAEGTDKHKVLDKGMVGHYDGQLETAMPWAERRPAAFA